MLECQLSWTSKDYTFTQTAVEQLHQKAFKNCKLFCRFWWVPTEHWMADCSEMVKMVLALDYLVAEMACWKRALHRNLDLSHSCWSSIRIIVQDSVWAAWQRSAFGKKYPLIPPNFLVGVADREPHGRQFDWMNENTHRSLMKLTSCSRVEMPNLESPLLVHSSVMRHSRRQLELLPALAFLPRKAPSGNLSVWVRRESSDSGGVSLFLICSDTVCILFLLFLFSRRSGWTMEKLKRSLSFRKKKDHVPECSKPHQWQEDERKVREGTCSFQVRVSVRVPVLLRASDTNLVCETWSIIQISSTKCVNFIFVSEMTVTLWTGRAKLECEFEEWWTGKWRSSFLEFARSFPTCGGRPVLLWPDPLWLLPSRLTGGILCPIGVHVCDESAETLSDSHLRQTVKNVSTTLQSQISRMCFHGGRNGSSPYKKKRFLFNHTTPFSTKGLEVIVWLHRNHF